MSRTVTRIKGLTFYRETSVHHLKAILMVNNDKFPEVRRRYMCMVFSWKYEKYFYVPFRLAWSFSGLNDEFNCDVRA